MGISVQADSMELRIRNMADSLHVALKVRAAVERKTLNQTVIDLLAQAVSITPKLKK